MQEVKIANFADGQNRIHGRVFEDRVIVGPAVLVLLRNNTIEECSFPGPWEQFVWLLPDHAVFGPIGLEGCTFRRCRFDDTVGLAGDERLRQQVLDDVLG